MKQMLTAALLCFGLTVYAQTGDYAAREKRFQETAAQAGADSSKPFGWTHNIVTGVNLTQVSFKDWVQGGENALSYTLWFGATSVQEKEKTHWVNTLKLAFGQSRLGSQGLRKTDDEIYFETLLIYKLGVYINPYAAGTFRTQFASGYKYDDLGTKTAVSKIFDPAYLTQSVGAAYQPIPEVTTRLGVAIREVLTGDFPRYADDPQTLEVEKTKVEGGIESVTDAEWKFAENMKFTSKLALFAPFKTLDEIILRNDNTITAKVNEYVNVSFNVQFIHDVTVTRRTQVKEVLAIGISYTLL